MGTVKLRKKKKKKHVPVRLNILFFAVFVMFSALILRLGIVQIVYGDDYKREIERTEDVTVSNSVPRGKIYDRYGKIIVDNQPLYAITYTRTQKTSSEEMLETAEKLSKLIEVETDKVRERDRKDFWILNNPEAAKKKITEKEYQQFSAGQLTDDDIYKLQLERITEEEIDYSQSELEVLAIYSKFISGYYLSPQIVKNNDTTYEEVARVNEQIESLPGVDTTTDWERKYTYGNTLKSVLGKVSSSSEGLPSDKTGYYLARGYSRNDRVGTSYLEQQYENLLRGQQEKIRNVTNSAGDIVSTEVISEGQRGKDLVLTVDMDLQIATEEIIEKQLREKKAKGGTTYLDRAFVVVTNPNTGEILTMAGKQYAADDNGKMKMNDMALGTFTSSYAMGSSVKGATILTGYQTGAIKPGQVMLDSPMKIKGTPDKKSWKNFGNINDIEALKVSSNVYMFKTAIALGHGNYVPGASLRVDNSAFSTMRKFYNQFGLGVKTGIDLPGEQIGYKGSSKGPGLLMDFSIGQYDTYTPLQLAQYVSTIANGGNRIKPHILKQVREPVDNEDDTLGPVIQEVEPEVLNTLPMKSSWIERVQEGFRQVTQSTGGTAYSYFGNADYKPAGKTGTAEAFYDGPKWKKGTTQPETYNITFVSYAPSKNPEIAMSIVVPWAYQSSSSSHKMNLEIAKEVYEKYFELKEERNK